MYRLFSRRDNVIAVVIVLLCGSIAVFAQGNSRHKVRASSSADYKLIEASGGALVADYGSFRVYQVSQIAPGLQREGLETRDDLDQIHLTAATLNTGDAKSKAAVKTVGGFSGKRLHLLHFA